MKRPLMCLMLVIFPALLTSAVFSQDILTKPRAKISLSLINTASDTIYLFAPCAGSAYCSTIPLPFDALDSDCWNTVRSFACTTTRGRGMSDDETDSLQITFYPMAVDFNNKLYLTIPNQKFYITFDNSGSVSDTLYTIDWESGHSSLSSLKTGDGVPSLLSDVLGYLITVRQYNDTGGEGIYEFNFYF